MRTKLQLVASVLGQMGVLDAIETPSAADSALIEGEYDAKLAEMRATGAAWWPNTSRQVAEIPLEVFPVLVDLIAVQVGAHFRQGVSLADRIELEKRALARLARMRFAGPSGEPTTYLSY